jgi:hypothetical protein
MKFLLTPISKNCRTMFLLKVILFFIVIYWALKSIGRIFLPILFNQAAQRVNKQNSYKQRKEGEITIHFEGDHPTKKDKKVGEYVDYEEIKD